MGKKLRVCVLSGGPSAEHEVSLMSAKNVVASLDRTKYDVRVIRIPRDAPWFPTKSFVRATDVVFPVLHGTYGEDGTVQGLLKAIDVPFVGASVLGSAVGMDKDVMKRLLKEAGIPIARFMTVTQRARPTFARAKRELGLPLFVKPANMGSSVGVSKVRTALEFDAALDHAFKFDKKILIEEFIKGREIEVSVLGNDAPEASIAGEIVPTHDFYTYEAKYLDENGARLEIPAKLSPAMTQKVRTLSINAYTTLCCEGLGRVDMFVSGTKAYVNEINTLPGFTNISMYPKLWEATGLTQPKLLDTLITLAIDRHREEKRMRTRR